MSISNPNRVVTKEGLSWLWTKVKSALSGKVDKVNGKGLSTNDFTTAEQTKLAGIAAGAEVNVQADWEETNAFSDAYIANKPSVITETQINNLFQ